MSIYLKVILFAVSLMIVPVGVFAQSDICSTLPYVATSGAGTPGEVIVEQMKQRSVMQMTQEQQRALWTSKMIAMKNTVPNSTLTALCIFHAEIVPQPALHMLSIRAPQELMSAIEDAVKRLDVPQVGPRSVELTVHVLVASDQDETLRPVPASLKPVVDQLKGVLSYKQFYLLDTLLSNTIDARRVSLNGDVHGLIPASAQGGPRDVSYSFQTDLNIGNGEAAQAPVRLSNLRFIFTNQLNLSISTDVDIPPGKQVVVGKSTAGDRAFILVVSAKILN
jgi:hypothetical protein